MVNQKDGSDWPQCLSAIALLRDREAFERLAAAYLTEHGEIPDSRVRFDVVSMLAGAVGSEFSVVADREATFRNGFLPAYMFFTWECVKP